MRRQRLRNSGRVITIHYKKTAFTQQILLTMLKFKVNMFSCEVMGL